MSELQVGRLTEKSITVKFDDSDDVMAWVAVAKLEIAATGQSREHAVAQCAQYIQDHLPLFREAARRTEAPSTDNGGLVEPHDARELEPAEAPAKN